MPFPYVLPFVFPGGGSPPTSTLTPDRSQRTTPKRRGLFEALIDAGIGALNDFAGQAVSRVSAPITADVTSAIGIESTLGFGEMVDGAGSARFLVGGEIIEATGRTVDAPFGFIGLTRGVDGTEPKTHPAGTIVLDLSGNTSALHHFKRGIFVSTALEPDLDVIGRNLGLHKCAGLLVEQWRRVIQVLAYLPKQPLSSYEAVLEALLGSSTLFRVTERPWVAPWQVFVEIDVPALSGDDAIYGSFILTGGEQQLSTALDEVVVDYAVGSVLGVYLASDATLRGERVGATNYYSGGGSFAGNVITLGSSPGAIGTALVIDYSVDPTVNYHYLAADANVVSDAEDRRPYFGDLYGPLAECLVNEVRSAGILPVVSKRTV
jgi:hypothetical protein